MVVMGYEFTGESPFEYVYIHGLIRDEKGQKMSKSKGNTIDPVEIIDKYGSDALRFTLTSLVTFGGQDIKLSDERFEFGRNFANKIWNASRFVLMNLEEMNDSEIDMTSLTTADRWILHKYTELVNQVTRNFEDFKFGEAASLLYEFIWNNYCDWYLEIAKVQLQNSAKKQNTQKVLRFILERILRLLHPIMPHITEEIWGLIPGEAYKDYQDILMISKYPLAYDSSLKNEQAEKRINMAIETIKSLRNIRQSFDIPPSKAIKARIYCENLSSMEDFELTEMYIKPLAKVDRISIEPCKPQHPPSQAATFMVGQSLIAVPLAGLIDIDKEIQRQEKKIETLDKEKQGLDFRMSSPKFLENAPKEVIQQTRQRINDIEKQKQAIEELLKSLVK
jgi:valyl-tRNA synthetase